MIRVLVAGLGNMGLSHALAYHNNPEFEIVGLVNRSDVALPGELVNYPFYTEFFAALTKTKPDLAAICTYSRQSRRICNRRHAGRGACICGKTIGNLQSQMPIALPNARVKPTRKMVRRIHPAPSPKLATPNRPKPAPWAAP